MIPAMIQNQTAQSLVRVAWTAKLVSEDPHIRNRDRRVITENDASQVEVLNEALENCRLLLWKRNCVGKRFFEAMHERGLEECRVGNEKFLVDEPGFFAAGSANSDGDRCRAFQSVGFSVNVSGPQVRGPEGTPTD